MPREGTQEGKAERTFQSQGAIIAKTLPLWDSPDTLKGHGEGSMNLNTVHGQACMDVNSPIWEIRINAEKEARLEARILSDIFFILLPVIQQIQVGSNVGLKQQYKA